MTFTPWKARGAAVASALLLAAAFPPVNAWLLAWVALVPLFLAVWARVPKAGKNEAPGPESRAPFWPGFRLGWLFGIVFFTATLWWIQYVTLPGMLAMVAYLSLYPAVAMGLTAWIGLSREESPWAVVGKLVLIAAVWTGLEWVRSVALWGFPWNGLAVPLFPMCSLGELAAFLGVTGLSFLVLLPTLGIAAAIRLAAGKSTKICLGLLIGFGVVMAGWEVAAQGRAAMVLKNAQTGLTPRLSAALVQPNLSMAEKMSPDPEFQRQRYFDLVAATDAALAANGPPLDLVVWPESAVPNFLDDMIAGGAFTDQLKQGNFSLITGADHRDWDKLYNSVAILRGTTDNRAVHPKVRLVPFGEFIPFRKEVPLFEKMLGDLIPMDFNAGTSMEPMKVKGQEFSVIPLVCFEDTIGAHARLYVRPEPQIIVNVTNDNWFQESPATEMHFANARWRAPELDRPLLRSANTGVTAIVTPDGHVQRLPSHQPGTLTGWVPVSGASLTFYARNGDLFAKVSGALSLLVLPVLWFRRKALAGTRSPEG